MAIRGFLFIGQVLILIALRLTSITCNTSTQQALQSDLPSPQTKITFPRLHPQHYKYFLKHHPLALREFENICNVFQDRNQIDVPTFRSLHANLTIEDPYYLEVLDYGLSIIRVICSSLKSIPRICWGYEKSCHDIYIMPRCGPDQTKEQMIRWFNQADFGFVAERRLELNRYASPEKKTDMKHSSLECTKYFRTCRALNLYVDLRLSQGESRTAEGILRTGEIGGADCYIETKRIKEEDGRRGPHASWFNELEHYKEVRNLTCDETITEPVYFIKLEQTTDMYDNFKNFMYLYSTMHLYQRFYDHNQIFLWNEEVPKSKFDAMWSVFSRSPPRTLLDLRDKRVCFSNAVFTMPSNIDVGFYHEKDFPDCSGTGLFHAFSTHVLYRLNIHQTYTQEVHQSYQNRLIRVAIIVGPSTELENLGQLINKFTSTTDENVRFVPAVFKAEESTDLRIMLQHIHNTDILIGLPGSDLAYTLFLPEWATLLEIPRPESNKYHNLAKFRGLSYRTDEAVSLVEDAASSKTKKSIYNLQVEHFFALLEDASREVKQKRSTFFKDVEVTRSANTRSSETHQSIRKPSSSREDL